MRWKEFSSTDERWTWWPAAMEKKEIRPITVSEARLWNDMSDR